MHQSDSKTYTQRCKRNYRVYTTSAQNGRVVEVVFKTRNFNLAYSCIFGFWV